MLHVSSYFCDLAGSEQENRHFGSVHHLHCHTTQPQPLQPASAVRRHHDEVCSACLTLVQYLLGWITDDSLWLNLEALVSESFRDT